MEKVDTKHKLYSTLSTKREVFHAVKGGTDAIQSKGEKFLPKYPLETSDDYKIRKSQSTIDGLVSSGCDTLSGAVFYGDIDTSKVHPSIVPLLENIDNKGTHFNVFARQAFDAAFDGSAVILVDMPKATEEGKKLQSVYGGEADRMLKIRPYWRLYFADDVINWQEMIEELTQATVRSLIVFHEPKDEVDPENKFALKTVDYYRVYYLEEGLVKWVRYKKTDKLGQDEFIIADPPAVLTNRSAIPVSVVGCLEDEPRLMVESRLEVKAYQKESSFDTIEYLSIPILCCIGRSAEAIGVPLKYGPSAVLDVPLEGDAKYLTIDAGGHDSLKNTIGGIKDTIKAKVNELVSSAMNSAEKTATQASIEDRDKQARLIVWAEQFKDALELALSFTAEAMGLGFDKGGEITLNTKWDVAKQEAQEQKERDAEMFKVELKNGQASAAVN